MRRKVSAVSAKESAHTAQASQGVVRVLIPPSLPCPCSLVPSVTTPLYSTTVSQALRGEGYEAITPVLPFSSVVGRDAATKRHGQAAWSPVLPPPVRCSVPLDPSPLAAWWRSLQVSSSRRTSSCRSADLRTPAPADAAG